VIGTLYMEDYIMIDTLIRHHNHMNHAV
jgi:hypothetical protein